MTEMEFDLGNMNNEMMKPDVRDFVVAVINRSAPHPFEIPGHGPASALNAHIKDDRIYIRLAVPESAVGKFDVEGAFRTTFHVDTFVQMHSQSS